MFRIYADEIEFDGRPVARFLPNLQPTFRDDVEYTLERAESDPVSREDHEKALKELDDTYRDEVSKLETERDEAIERAEKAEALLDAIDDGIAMADLRDQLEAANKAVSEWRSAYETLKRETAKSRRRRP